MNPRVGQLALLLLTAGCAADLGVGAGGTVKDPHAVGVARAGGSTRLGAGTQDHGFLAGASFENRIEAHRGSRWSAGLLAGYGSGPATLGGRRIGWELFGELGVPVRRSLLGDGDYYLGAAAALPIALERGRNLTDLNKATWILRRRAELVPMLRGRFYQEGADAPPYEDKSPAPHERLEIAFVLSLRIRVETDLN
jgi:hypothetical protein